MEEKRTKEKGEEKRVMGNYVSMEENIATGKRGEGQERRRTLPCARDPARALPACMCELEGEEREGGRGERGSAASRAGHRKESEPVSKSEGVQSKEKKMKRATVTIACAAVRCGRRRRPQRTKAEEKR